MVKNISNLIVFTVLSFTIATAADAPEICVEQKTISSNELKSLESKEEKQLKKIGNGNLYFLPITKKDKDNVPNLSDNTKGFIHYFSQTDLIAKDFYSLIKNKTVVDKQKTLTLMPSPIWEGMIRLCIFDGALKFGFTIEGIKCGYKRGVNDYYLASLLPDGLVTVTEDNHIKTYDNEGHARQDLSTETHSIVWLGTLPNGKIIFTCDDGTLHMWEPGKDSSTTICIGICLKNDDEDIIVQNTGSVIIKTGEEAFHIWFPETGNIKEIVFYNKQTQGLE